MGLKTYVWLQLLSSGQEQQQNKAEMNSLALFHKFLFAKISYCMNSWDETSKLILLWELISISYLTVNYCN